MNYFSRYVSLCVLPITVVILVLTGCGSGSSPVLPPTGPAKLTVVHTEILSKPPDHAYDAHIALNTVNSDLYICWARKIGEGTENFWRYGQPGHFSKEIPLTEVDGIRSWNPSIAAGSDGRIHFAFMDQKIDELQKEIYAKTWSGNSWGPETHLSLLDGWTGWDPDVEVYPDGRPVVAWFDHRYEVQHEILMRIGDGYGQWWPDIRLTNDNHWQYFPDIEIGKNSVLHLSWVDARYQPDEREDADHYAEGKNLEIFYRTFNGMEIGPEVRISETPLRSIASRMAVDDSGKAHIVFLDESARGYYVLYYVNIIDNVVSAMKPVSKLGCRADLAAITTIGNRIFTMYPEYPDPSAPPTGRSNMYLREILPDGVFGVELLIGSTATNLHPDIVSDPENNMLWVVWMEYGGSDETFQTGDSRIRLSGISLEY